MEVILLKDTDLGDKGAVVKVANGYARNYLIPNQIAVAKTAGALRHVAVEAQHKKNKLAREKQAVEAIIAKLNAAAPVILKTKGGDNGAMFGAITHAQIVDAAKEALGIEIDKRRILIKAIKDAAVNEVPIRFPFALTGVLKVKVELEVEKKKEDDVEAKGRKKPRKKEEILAELEPAKDEAAVDATAEVAAEKPKAKRTTKKAKEAKAE